MWSLNPGRRESHVSSQSVHTGLEHPASCSMGTKGSFPRTNRQRRLADHSYHPYVVPMLGISGVIPLFFLHAFVVYTGTTVLLKENVSLFRCSHYTSTEPRTPEGNQHKRNLSPTRRSLTWRKEKGQESPRTKSEREGLDVRDGGGDVAVEYSVFGKSRVQISVRVEFTLIFLLI
jgi:hypothetical protein